MDMPPLREALAGFRTRLADVGDRWSATTPCADWDVRALTGHVLGELLWIPPLLGGQTIEQVGDRFEGDQIGTDALAAWDAAAAGALAAAAEPGALERTVHLSFGDFPGVEYLGQVTSDVVIHTWDLARGIGADDDLGGDLVAYVDSFLGPQVDAWRSAGAFGPAVEAGDGASAQDRLLALTGRAPSG